MARFCYVTKDVFCEIAKLPALTRSFVASFTRCERQIASMTSTTAPKTVLETIFEWSIYRPLWQRDALRRIVGKGKLAESDISELVALCKQGLRGGANTVQAQPLEQRHLPSNPGAGASVSLLSIKDIQDANILAPSQTLAFAPRGVTVIYGDNGAGKSGYARILKRACFARHRAEILGNIFSQTPVGPASATIEYSIGDTAQAPEKWQDSDSPHPTLSAVIVFDGDCALTQIKEKNEVAFRPFGLDVPDELATACQRVKDSLATEQKRHEMAQNALFANPPWKPQSAVGRAVAGLRHDTAAEKLAAIAILTKEERARLDQLREDLSKDPAKAAAEQRARADNIKGALDALAIIESATADDALNSVFTEDRAAKAKRDTARAAAEKAFSAEQLTEIGAEAWRGLWDAARRYSARAYPTQPFPAVQDDALCILCQQPLEAAAKERLARFETFIKEDTERQAQDAEKSTKASQKKVAAQRLSTRAIIANLREIELHDPVQAKALRRFFASARLRRYALLKTIAGVSNTLTLPAIPDNPRASIAALERRTRAYSEELRKAAGTDERKKLEGELGELVDRAALHDNLQAVKDEIARLKEIHFLGQCAAEAATNSITTLGNGIADTLITPQLRDRFAKEIINLVSDAVRVEIVRSGGKYGSPQYQVRLLAKPTAPVADVLSEGEQTCVAIAAFLAELATAPHNSALVFDDPVSSLDHKWRNKVAQRLVEESATRQVIVFTHDLIFLNDIEDAAHDKSLPFQARHIRRKPDAVGFINDDLPWEGMKIAERIDALEKNARALGRERSQQDDETYKRAARHFYSDLRDAWERALEEVAFAHVIMRHRDHIKDKDLLKVSVLTEQDCKSWNDNFGKCCDNMAGHDGSRGRNRSMPEPNELLTDVRALDGWVKAIREKQKVFK